MKVFIIGNPLFKKDNLPLKLLPKLRQDFPNIVFAEVDPNENFIPEEGSVIIDTVEGIDDIRWFDSLDEFITTKSVSPHDYDLGFHLRLLLKLKKIRKVKILGIPVGASETEVLNFLKQEITST